MKYIIHIDMDAFFASIEQRDNPKLIGKPIAVGGHPDKRGVVCAASYEARKYGVKSAMSSRRAKALCKHLVFVPTNKYKYQTASNHIRNIFKRYSSNIEPLSLDEAYLEINDNNPIKIANSIKNDIKKELNLSCSVGVSYNKFLAKLASDMDKPNGMTIINKEDSLNILKPLPIRKLWGVGPKTEKALNRMGIYKISDIQDYDEKVLVDRLGKKGKELMMFAKGIDNRKVEGQSLPQSISEENTFSYDIENLQYIHEKIDEYSVDIHNRIIKKGYKYKTITIKLKYDDFSIETRSYSLENATDDLDTLKNTSHFIINNKFTITKKIRLLGLGVSNFIYPNDPIQIKINLDSYF
ncbi:DNA polymerase IV [Anaeromonas frigoriresistens]|uniref:DNA polymerase IV n=1 Tax=Anaeromonas frigoriresistens TaxID=2683708 RepID=UPI002078CA9C|nr:DNA polymerase IV [Anaeromonas frigoriresistens]